MDAQLTRKLNSIDWSDYPDILQHIQSRNNPPIWYPNNVNTNFKRNSYNIRYQNFFATSNGIEYVHNGIQLIVVQPQHRDAKLRELFYNVNNYGSGIIMLYKKVTTKYLGISRKYVNVETGWFKIE